MDLTLKDRVHRHQTRRQEVLAEMAGLKRQKELPQAQLGQKQVATFCEALKRKLRDRSSHFGKEYLKLLIEEVRVEGTSIRIRGSHAALAGLLQKTKVGDLKRVPTFGGDWLPSADSNHGPGG